VTSERRRQRRQPTTRNVARGARRHWRRKERTAAACCYFATRRAGNPRVNPPRDCAVSLSRVSRHAAGSLSRPHAAATPAIFFPLPLSDAAVAASLSSPLPPPLPPSLPPSRRHPVLPCYLTLSPPLSLSLSLSLSPSLSLALARSLSLSLSFSLGTRASAPGSPSPRRYPTTGVSSNQPPLGPLAPCRAHPPARVTSQQRSPRPRPRAETDRESSAFRQSAIRLAATPRHAARSACVSAPRFKKPASERRSPTSRAPRAVNHRRGATPRGSRRACDPSGFRLFNRIPLRHGDRQYRVTKVRRSKVEGRPL